MQIRRPKIKIPKPKKDFSPIKDQIVSLVVIILLVILVAILYLGYVAVSTQTPANYLTCPKGDWKGPLTEAIPVSSYVYANGVPIALQITYQCPNDHTNITTVTVPLPIGGI